MYNINKKYNKYILLLFIIITICIFLLLLFEKKNRDGFETTTSTSATYSAGENLVWTVPVGIREATFTVIGGKGGNSYDEKKIGGFGGKVTTTINNLKDGDKYNIYVGNNGKSDGNAGIDNGFYSSVKQNGLMGGGYGFINGGGGGAASYIIYNNTSIIVAGGGGGAGIKSKGGNACINNSSNGGNGDNYPNYYKGGLGGFSSTSLGNNSMQIGAGGGGGGYLGGGTSTTYFTGGGAGSSYVTPTNSFNTSYITDTTGNPSIIIDWSVKQTTTQPTTTQASTTEAITTEAITTEAITTEATTTKPITIKPATIKPANIKLVTIKPVTTKPATTKPKTTIATTTQQTTIPYIKNKKFKMKYIDLDERESYEETDYDNFNLPENKSSKKFHNFIVNNGKLNKFFKKNYEFNNLKILENLNHYSPYIHYNKNMTEKFDSVKNL